MKKNITKAEKIAAVRAMNEMTVEELTAAMGTSKSVTVEFYKRGNGEYRVCRCTRNWDVLKRNGVVTEFVEPNGKGLPFDRYEKGLVSAWDLENKKWVLIPANSTMVVK